MRYLLTLLLCAATTLNVPLIHAMGSESNVPVAAKTEPDYAAGKKAVDAKDWQRAITALNAAAQRDGNNADIQNLLDDAQRNSGNLNVALKHYDKALTLDPKHLGAREYLGELYLMQNNPAKAEEQRAVLAKLCALP